MITGQDLGTVPLNGTLVAPVITWDTNGVGHDPAALPTYRIYGQGSTPMNNGLGSPAKLDTVNVTAASNASPVQVTAANHGYQTGLRVNVSGVLGNTGANAETTVTVVDANNFTLDGTTGNGPYTSGGQAHVAGLYQVSQAVNASDGYEAGFTYYLVLTWTLTVPNVGVVTFSCVCPFRVV